MSSGMTSIRISFSNILNGLEKIYGKGAAKNIMSDLGRKDKKAPNVFMSTLAYKMCFPVQLLCKAVFTD